MLTDYLDAPASPPRLRCEPFDARGWLVRLEGEFDVSAASDLADAAGRGIGGGRLHLVVDLSGATLFECASLAALIAAIEPLRREPDAAVVLAGAHGPIARLLHLLAIDELFDLYQSQEEAMAALREPAPDLRQGWRAVSDERPEPLLAVLVAQRRAARDADAAPGRWRVGTSMTLGGDRRALRPGADYARLEWRNHESQEAGNAERGR